MKQPGPDDLPEIRALFRAETLPAGLDRWRHPEVEPKPVPRRPRALVFVACAAAVAVLAGGIPAIIRAATAVGPPIAVSPTVVAPPTTVPPSAAPPTTAPATTSPPATSPTTTPPPATSRPPTSRPPAQPTIGVPAGTTLRTHDGDLVVRTAGAVVDALRVNGSIIVEAPDVRIRRTRVVASPDSYWVIRQAPAATNLVVEDSELDGQRSHEGVKQEAAGLTVSRTRIQRVDTGVTVSDRGRVEYCLITDVAAGIGTSFGGTGITIRDNTITTTKSSVEAAIGLYTTNGGALRDVTVERNRLAGGNYTFHVGEGPGPLEIVARNNRFSRSVHPNGGAYGPTAGWDAGGGSVWSGNVWDDTGAPVNP